MPPPLIVEFSLFHRRAIRVFAFFLSPRHSRVYIQSPFECRAAPVLRSLSIPLFFPPVRTSFCQWAGGQLLLRPPRLRTFSLHNLYAPCWHIVATASPLFSRHCARPPPIPSLAIQISRKHTAAFSDVYLYYSCHFLQMIYNIFQKWPLLLFFPCMLFRP